MALRVLMLRKKLDERRAALEELRAAASSFQMREAELEQAIGEAGTDEEKETVEAAVDQFDKDRDENTAACGKLEGEIKDIEKEIEELERKAPAPTAPKTEFRGGMTGMNTRRDERLAYLAREEVRDFYTRLAQAVSEKRALMGTEQLIPESVVDMIQLRLGDYGTLYNEVNRITLTGTLRAILDGAVPEGAWVEMTGALTELAASFKAVEADGYKVGGYVPVANSIIEDSMLNLSSYIETRLAQAIAKALDKAILKGTGAAGKQPVGIIPSLADANKPAPFVYDVGKVLACLGDIDDGENAVGEIIAVMKRSTYYKRVVPNTVTMTADGRQVAQSVSSPNVAGVRVVFNNYMDEDTALVGDFKKYLLAERAGVSMAVSTDVKFIEDQTVIKATARYDGKPVHLDENGKAKDWVLLTFTDPANP